MRKQGVEDPKSKLKNSLETLSISQLKSLADKHHIKVKGTVVDDMFDSYRKAPTKKQYISKLAGIITEKELSSIPKETPKKVKRRPRRDDSWW